VKNLVVYFLTYLEKGGKFEFEMCVNKVVLKPQTSLIAPSSIKLDPRKKMSFDRRMMMIGFHTAGTSEPPLIELKCKLRHTTH
jgi:hypothetical protein